MQIQEALTSQIADAMQEVLKPHGVGVVIEAAHQCMTTRGIRKPGVSMVTSRMLGSFRDDPTTRREFLAMIGAPGAAPMAPDKSVPAAVAAFAARTTVEQVEEGLALAPKFDADGLIPCIATDANTGEVLMLGYMNGEALQRTIATGEAYYWSRSSQCLWRRGATSGLVQEVVAPHAPDFAITL